MMMANNNTSKLRGGNYPPLLVGTLKNSTQQETVE
jgi:hypothetical protein